VPTLTAGGAGPPALLDHVLHGVRLPAWLAGAGMALSSLAVVLHALQLAKEWALLSAD
jgi:cation transport ATPase